jgi:surface antigen
LWSYIASDGSYVPDEEGSELPMFESSDSFLSVNTILDDERDLTWTNEIIDYEVKFGDTISGIAYSFKVSNNSIYWANDFSRNSVIRPWDVIKIPPVSGLIHQVKKGDTIGTIAKKYNVGETKILSQNLLSSDDTLKVWEVIVVPWAIKKVKKPVYKNPPKQYASKSSGWWYSFAKGGSKYVNAWWKYQLVWRKPKANFYWGNCTWYVAQYKNVNWQWNANQWLTNAQRKWHKTWSTPTLWSIVVFSGRWYNPRYGHVWIVTDIKWWDIIVSDMNYRKINEVTYRRVPINNRSIKWYIYID